MRQHPHLVHPRQQQHYATQQHQPTHHHTSSLTPQTTIVGINAEVQKKHKRAIGGPYLTQQRSFSSSEEELRSTPDFEGKSFSHLYSFHVFRFGFSKNSHNYNKHFFFNFFIYLHKNTLIKVECAG